VAPLVWPWRCDVSKIRYCYRDHKNHLLFVIDRLIARKPNVTCIPTPLLNWMIGPSPVWRQTYCRFAAVIAAFVSHELAACLGPHILCCLLLFTSPRPVTLSYEFTQRWLLAYVNFGLITWVVTVETAQCCRVGQPSSWELTRMR